MAPKITLYIAISEDGFIASADGSVAWLDQYNSLGEDYGYPNFIKSIDSVVMGNTTYEQVLGFGDYPYSDKKSFVFTTKDKSAKGITFVNSGAHEFVESLDVKHLWLIGGANLFKQFQVESLIDEYIIHVMPFVLGDGIKLFDDSNSDILSSLKKVKTYHYGVVELRGDGLD